MQVASALQWAEDFPPAFEHARRAIEIAEAAGAQGPLGGGLYVRGYLNAVSGRLDVAEGDVRRALAIGRAVGDTSRQALALHILALRHGWQGDYRASLDLADEGVLIARHDRLVVPLLRCLWNQALAWNDLGEHDRALAALLEGLALAEKLGDDAYVPRYLNTIGWLRVTCGDHAAGVELCERSYAITGRSARAGHGTGAERRAFIRVNEADAWMAQDDLAAAAGALEEVLHTVRHPPPSRWMTWRYGMHGHASRGALALRRGDPETARRSADEALELATPTGSRKFESLAWRIKGEGATMRRAWDEAEAALRRALGIAEAIGQPHQTWRAHLALGRLATARGRPEEARARRDHARRIVATLLAGAQDPGIRAGLRTCAREIDALA